MWRMGQGMDPNRISEKHFISRYHSILEELH